MTYIHWWCSTIAHEGAHVLNPKPYSLHLRRGLGGQNVNEAALENASIQRCKSSFSIAWLQKLDQSNALGLLAGSTTRLAFVAQASTHHSFPEPASSNVALAGGSFLSKCHTRSAHQGE